MLSLVPALSGCGHHGAQAADTDDTATPPPLVAVSTVTVQPQNIARSLSVTGTLAPLPGAEAKVAAAAPGRVAQVFVQPGEHVQRGQVLAVLEPGALVGQTQQATAAVSAANASLAQAQANYQSTVQTNAAAIAAARTNLQAAEVALQKLLAGSRPEEIAHAEADVAAAQAAAVNAQQNLDREELLFKEGLAARRDVEAAQLALNTAQASLRATQEDLRLKQHPNRPQDVAAARLGVQQARDALNAALAAASQNRVKAGDVAIAARQVQASEGALNAAHAQIRSEVIRSPVSGVVTDRSINPGEYLDTTSAVAMVADLRRVRVLLQVPAADIGAVQPGDPVQFSPQSRPGASYIARVSLISTAVTPGSNTIQVTAVAPNTDGQLRDDGFVQAKIITAMHRNALVVPAAAIVTVNDKPTVFVVGKDNVAHAHTVTTGVRQGDSTEVLSGVAAGDRIVTTGAYELSDGAKVKVGA